MNADIKSRWVKALRSGEYTQGRCTLRTEDNRFCCLGVLCDILKEELKIEWEHRSVPGNDPTILRWHFNGDCSILSPKVLRYAELETTPQVDVVVDGALNTLTKLNDTYASFTNIADIIEDQL